MPQKAPMRKSLSMTGRLGGLARKRDAAGLFSWVALFAVGILLGTGLAYQISTGSTGMAHRAVDLPSDRLARSGLVAGRAPNAIDQVGLAGRLPDRLAVSDQRPRRSSPVPQGGADKPRIAIVIDDLGFDEEAFDRLNAAPGPLTLSFLPFAPLSPALVAKTDRARHEVMLHLPLEPLTWDEEVVGPDTLQVDDDAAELAIKLQRNLSAFAGYDGVNGHQGSRFTADEAAMTSLLALLHEQGLYFLDSRTAPTSSADAIGAALDMPLLSRDVFLDTVDRRDAAEIRAQLSELERIAREEGAAIAIGHPYPATVEVVTGWLLTAELRGFEVVRAGDLLEGADPTPALALR